MVCFTGSQIKPALKGEVDASKASRRRGYIGAALVFVNPSVNPPCGVLPAPRPGSLLVRFTGSQIKPALKGAVDASKASRRRGCIGAVVIYVNPSVNPPCGVLPAPRPGSLLVRFTGSQIKPALKGAVDASKASRRRGCIGAVVIYVNPSVKPPQGGFHMAQPYFTLRRQSSYVKPGIYS